MNKSLFLRCSIIALVVLLAVQADGKNKKAFLKMSVKNVTIARQILNVMDAKHARNAQVA